MAKEEIRVLNVDDDAAGRYAKSRILRFAGYQVLEAATGFEALTVAEKAQPTIILLDVNLPDYSGFEVCRRLRSQISTADIPILMSSAVFNRGADRARGIEGGADGYLSEPVEPEVVQATIESIVRSKRAELAVRRSASQWDETFKAITDGIALLDDHGIILRTNPALREITELDQNLLEGQPIITILEKWAYTTPVDQHVLTSSARTEIEIERDGRWFVVTFDPVIEGAERNGSVCIFSDITARKKYEDALNLAKQAAESANAAKDQFLAVLSHELRTPLTPALMLLESLLGDEPLPPFLHSSLEVVHRNVSLEARLIDDLLDLTRIVKGKIHLDLEEISIHRLIELVLEICHGEIEQKKLTMNIDLAATSTTVLGDPARIQQILWNLIKNAIKFTPSQRSINITTSNVSTDSITVVVEDTGIGMEPEIISKIFNAFDQGEQAITQRFGGLGLGLAISKNLVDLHKGTLIAESEGREKGSRFILTLPTLP